jgi:hypothetical protein
LTDLGRRHVMRAGPLLPHITSATKKEDATW